MDAPPIRYARTSDGVNIAYSVMGEGRALVLVPSPPDNHLQLEWDDPERRRNIEAFSRRRMVVRYDPRGAGLSQRDVDDFSLERRLLDLEAVLERLNIDEFAIVTGSHGGHVAVAYAARHPGAVTHLVVVNPFTRGNEFMKPEQLHLFQHLLEHDYRLFTDTIGAEIFGWGREEGPIYAANFRESVTGPTAGAIYEAMLHVDLSELLPQVTCPVLVLNTTGGGPGEAGSREFAALLPNATIALVAEKAFSGPSTAMRVAIGRFMGEDWSEEEAPPVAAASPGPVFRSILFTDLVGHTEMMQRLGDLRGREVLREHERLTRAALGEHGGSEVKTMGDGFMASFGSAQKALECATALQRAFGGSAVLGTESSAGLRVRVGINAGEPIAEDGDLFGSSVIAAARIAARAEGGQVLVADVVRQLVAGKGFLFADTGEHILRGMEEPVRVWELRWADRG